jgi:lambda repressor-like predicted transcriptional regulator
MKSGGNRLRSLVADFVAALQNSCWPSRTPMKKQTRIHQHPQNSSYKVQHLHAAVPLQSGSNRLRSLVADFVGDLQNSCWPSRTPAKKQTRIQH